MAQHNFEVWYEESSTHRPPKILLVYKDAEVGIFQILDCQMQMKVVFESRSYTDVRHWLTEDEFDFLRQSKRFDES